MRGNKFLKPCVVVAMLMIAVATIFASPTKSIKNVKAEDNSIYNNTYVSQKYDDGVVLSVEQVYFAEDRQTELTYSSDGKDTLTNILGYGNKNNYFANYGLTNSNNSKKIVRSGEYVMLDSDITRNAYNEENPVALKQGVMITLGGYIFDNANGLHTNSEGYDSGTERSSYMSKLQSVSVSMSKTTGTITQTTAFDASLRTYNKGLYFDFVHFIDSSSANEGHYQLSINYTQEGSAPKSHSFEFFILSKTSYTHSVDVNGLNYNSAPNLSITNVSGEPNNYKSTTFENPVVLTYNYKYYDLSFTHEQNDLVSSVNVELIENETEKQIVLHNFVNGLETSSPSYTCVINNDIISFVFASKGEYQFNFNYAYYYYNQETLSVERRKVKNLEIEPIKLNIHGYELKYKKTGFNSADMRSYEIVANGTTIIAYNGYDNSIITSQNYDLNKDLGYMYSFVAPNANQKTGTIIKTESADITKKIIFKTEAAKIEIDNNLDNNLDKRIDDTIIEIDTDNKVLKFNQIGTFSYTETDQGGLFLSLTDYYKLDAEESYYIYSETPFVTGGEYLKVNMSKATDFTKHGYYFVRVGYTETSGGDIVYQYFAFRNFTATAKVELYTTDKIYNTDFDKSTDTRIYSNQYTNKNVYGSWLEPSTFNSKQNVTITHALQGQQKYWDKDTMLAFAEGKEANSMLMTEVFEKESSLLQESGSYLLTVQIEGKQTKAVYYFVIDKDPISGIDVLGVSYANIGNSKVFNIARDNAGNPISYTEKALINSDFTLWWDNKASGASITTYYTRTSFIQDNTKNSILTGNEGGVDYSWGLTNYTESNTSKKVRIDKPSSKTAMVSADNVRTDQGIYWFYLEDQAGNTREYVIIYDNTPIQISAKTVKESTPISSGDLVAEDVYFDWGTHKAIELGAYSGSGATNINEQLYKQFIEKTGSSNYFNDNGSNASAIVNNLKVANGKLYIVVKNEFATIEGSHSTSEYELQSNGSYTGGDDWSHVRKADNNHALTIGCNTQEISYSLRVYGENHTRDAEPNSFNVTLNPDKSEGVVKSINSNNDYVKVWAYNDGYNKDTLQDNYLESHATTDEVLVFEWFADVGGDFEVAEVYYQYYPIMSQQELNAYDNTGKEFDFFPYYYSAESTKQYIAGGEQNAKNYTTFLDGEKVKNRSTALNVGYTTYFNENGDRIDANATLPGLYIITRIYKNDAVAKNDAKERVYVFTVDRTGIIEYSISDYTTKVVGAYIDLFVQKEIKYDYFTQPVDQYEEGEDADKIVYDIYLQSNRLPLEVRVPTGKFVKVDKDGKIVRTSNSEIAGLKLNIKFVDKYNYLGLDSIVDDENYINFTLFEMTDMDMKNGAYITEDYISFLLTANKLYKGDGNQSINYLLACSQTNNTFLSLPGIYLIEIVDNTGSEMNADKANRISKDPKNIIIGVEITKSKPNIHLYSSHTTKNNSLDYANFVVGGENVKLDYSTSKAYIRYELPKINNNSTEAQINPQFIYIMQDGTIYYDSVTNQGKINVNSQFESNGELIKYIQELEDKYIIWLDTGLTIENGQIVDYKEYSYEIKVRYELGDKNEYLNSYIYYLLNEGVRNKEEQYYETTFKVNIDRTASNEILNHIITQSSGQNQTEFLENFINEQKDNSFVNTGKLDSKIYNTVAYRTQDGQDNYAIVNKLYYYYLEQGDFEKAEQSIYAIKVNASENYDKGQTHSTNVYYRKLTTASESARRMAILPVSSMFDKLISGFVRFSPSQTSEFKIISISNDMKWERVLSDGIGYYEIIEVDDCGNMTQYVINLTTEEENSYNFSVTFIESINQQDDSKKQQTANFNFAQRNEDETLNLSNPSLNISTGSVNISLDFWNNDFEVQTVMSNDVFYKVLLTDAVSNDIYLNYYLTYLNSESFATNIEKVIEENTFGNYVLTITNRYNQSLILNIDIYEPGQEYQLNIDNFNPYKEDETWYINASSLKSNINGVEIYATKIVFDGTDNKEWNANDDDKIELTANIVYNAIITDSKGRVYNKLIRTYTSDGVEDSSITVYGKEEAINNIHYTANPVEVEFNTNLYNSSTLKIIKDGAVIFNGGIALLPAINEDTYIHTVYGVEIYNFTDNNRQTLRFYPYVINGNHSVGYTGSKLEFELNLNAIDNTTKTYNFVIDNRMPAVTLINTDAEDKSDIIVSKFNYSNEKNSLVTYDYDKLFEDEDLQPVLTLSETVILGWTNYSYASYEPYYKTGVKLVKWNSKTEWIDSFDLSNKQITLTPKEFEMGRYCLIIEFLNNNGELICYKAYSFNIATTANAMYEVLDSHNNNVGYQETIKGEEIFSYLSELADANLLTELNMLTEGEKTLFSQQVLPMYISNSTLRVIPNGKNGIKTLSYSYAFANYTLTIYKVYSLAHTTYLAILHVDKTSNLLNLNDSSEFYFVSNGSDSVNLASQSSYISDVVGNLYFKNYYQDGATGNDLLFAKKNKMYLDIYYQFSQTEEDTKYLGKFFGINSKDGINFISLNKAGRYLIYLKDYAGNSMVWNKGGINESEFFTLTVLPEVIISVNGGTPIDYAFYNVKIEEGEVVEGVTVTVGFVTAGYYDNSSVQMFAYLNGNTTDYITSTGGRKTNLISSFTFTDYGTYRVVIKATRNGVSIDKTLIFSILNSEEARLALDFTSISKYDITKVVNSTTGLDVTDIFISLLNENTIYSKLIDFERLSAENAFGSTMGKQTFEVFYNANIDPLLPKVSSSFKFTINNQTPSLKSSLAPGKSTTKNITIKFNAQTIYRQVGDCHIVVNDQILMSINSETAIDVAQVLTLKNVGEYYVKIVSDSGRVLVSFKVTIKEPLNTWSIILIVAIVLLVVGVIVTFIVLRTKMRVR